MIPREEIIEAIQLTLENFKTIEFNDNVHKWEYVADMKIISFRLEDYGFKYYVCNGCKLNGMNSSGKFYTEAEEGECK